METKILDSLEGSLPLIPEMIGLDMQISLCNRTHVVDVWPAKSFVLPAAVSGVELSGDNPAHRNLLEVMETGRASVDILPKEIFGEQIKGILTPVYENGEIVGVVACATSLREMDQILTSSENLFTNLTQTQDAVEDIANGSVSLAEKINSISQAAEIVNSHVNKAVNCVTAIQNNTSRSNILALNGSIEAARAGEGGRGFDVIAKEMRKFAQNNADTAKLISEALTAVAESVKLITNKINEVNNVATQQVASTEEITATLNDITELALMLVDNVKA